jgi:hypothetical protein
MTLSADPQSEMSFEVSIPSALLLNPNIDPACVKLFAFIKSLTRAHGYCFASNGYLAKLMGTTARSVQRYLMALKNEEYLEIEIDTIENQCKRKIFLGKKVKKEPRPDNAVVPPRQICRTPTTDLSCISLYSISNIEEEKPPIVPQKGTVEELSFPPFVKLKKTEYDALIAKRGKPAVDEMIATMNDDIESKGRKPYENYAAALRNWFRLRDQRSGTGAFIRAPVDKAQRDIDGNDLNAKLSKVF